MWTRECARGKHLPRARGIGGGLNVFRPRPGWSPSRIGHTRERGRPGEVGIGPYSSPMERRRVRGPPRSSRGPAAGRNAAKIRRAGPPSGKRARATPPAGNADVTPLGPGRLSMSADGRSTAPAPVFTSFQLHRSRGVRLGEIFAAEHHPGAGTSDRVATVLSATIAPDHRARRMSRGWEERR